MRLGKWQHPNGGTVAKKVPEHSDLAEYFDTWYANMAATSVIDEIQQRHLGLPPELLSTSLLTWDGINDVTVALALEPGDLLLDLACGRGGYGLEIAERTGARLIGIDFAASALQAARAQAGRRGVDADFREGDLVATGLEDGSVDAVLVVDAIQFPDDPSAAYREIARVLRPGVRVALTCWEASSRQDESLPERIRKVDLRGGLVSAGFVDIRVTERADWREAERRMWAEAAALDPRDDPALQSFHEEGVRAGHMHDRSRRLLATARKPG